MKATYLQSGLDRNVKSLKKIYVDSYIDKNWQNAAANIFMLTKMIQEKQLTYRWSF